MIRRFIGIAAIVTAVALPNLAQAQGVPGGVERGAREGERASGDIDFGVRASPFFLDMEEDLTKLHRRWFDARMRGRATGIDDDPPVKVFVMGPNRWRFESEWPPARAVTQEWNLHGGGSLSRSAPTES